MIIDIDAARRVALADPRDFKRFKLRIAGPRTELAAFRVALGALATLEDSDTAWVSEAGLRALAHADNDAAWQEGLTRMIAAAAKFGWIDQGRGAIKAHVDWV